jgi:hypothetical protein
MNRLVVPFLFWRTLSLEESALGLSTHVQVLSRFYIPAVSEATARCRLFWPLPPHARFIRFSNHDQDYHCILFAAVVLFHHGPMEENVGTRIVDWNSKRYELNHYPTYIYFFLLLLVIFQ